MLICRLNISPVYRADVSEVSGELGGKSVGLHCPSVGACAGVVLHLWKQTPAEVSCGTDEEHMNVGLFWLLVRTKSDGVELFETVRPVYLLQQSQELLMCRGNNVISS